MSKPTPMHFTHLIYLSLWLIFGVPANSFAKVPPVLTILTGGITIDGPHTAYTIEIYEDGLVHYHGDVKVNVIGDREAKITPQQVQQLIAIYKKIDKIFKKWEALDKYGELYPHDSYVAVQLQYQGEISVRHALGLYIDNLTYPLNQMTPIKNWLCFPENDPVNKGQGCALDFDSLPIDIPD
ncbi:DUF6438 domain-containing protein [Methylovulum psychrotolerans]|uniref:DUF6438 domain-containing protein n=1 Tax=Methylovulum psychrotolerans TaxID=1704499 RepID=A0A2S5CL83_9GAMM|nr:DUF6438 domain-containing protein [Methylovulum psychrotolerans]POZ51546.1 hypothetical protein AADEFJLK_02412 [Methylovulum psychrotolerans]